MGMTRVFYMVKKNQLTPEKIRGRLSEASASDTMAYTIFFQETKDWFSVFSEWICEGQYEADLRLMDSLEKLFGSPVIALATFDSDIAFVSVCENGKLCRYVRANETLLEEYGFEEYESAVPAELEKYVGGKELQELWERKYVFEEDRLQDLAQMLNAFLVFDDNDVEEGVEII